MLIILVGCVWDWIGVRVCILGHVSVASLGCLFYSEINTLVFILSNLK